MLFRSNRGMARPRRGYFTVPTWAWKYGEHYVMYYTIHELTHFSNGGMRHGDVFKQIEDTLLALFDLEIERKKVYPKCIRHKKVVVYTKSI